MGPFIILLIAVCGLQALPTREATRQEWEAFKVTHEKEYADTKEENLRNNLFLKNLQQVEEHNANYEQGLVSYKLEINQFSDYTDEELHSYIHGIVEPSKKLQPDSTFIPPKNFEVPNSKDWRDEGAVPLIKDQGGCGSCWAFSVTGAIESHYRIYQNKGVSLSEQQLVDCVTDNLGCGGGWIDTAFTYITNNNGLNTEEDYPYQGVNGTCSYDALKDHYTIAGFVSIESGNEQDLLVAVAEKGPIAVAIDASGDFAFYRSGVYYRDDCSTEYLNHAVVVVGYGAENGQDYWLVRNSWGPCWGDNGYIKMARNSNNTCGIATAASYPTL